MEKSTLKNLTAVSEVYGSGQKIISAVLEYNVPVSASSLSASHFAVEGRTIAYVSVSDSFRGPATQSGRFVELALDPGDENASAKVRLDEGRHGRLALRPVSLTVCQCKGICAENGLELPPFEGVQSMRADNGVMDCFASRSFVYEEKTLHYNLYIPQNPVSGQKYPLVLFMHDAGSCSDEVTAPLAQGSGAVVWARDAESGKRPCYVVAPHYPEVCANDEFEVGWQAEATVALVRSLTVQFAVDKSRIYGTGQSMGCMMLCEMLLRHPGFFAGCLLIAGQWNPETMASAKDAVLWAVVAEGDAKAFPILGACYDNMEKAGGRVYRSHWDACADMSILDQAVRRQKAAGCHLNFTWFEGKSILPFGAPDHPGMHHVSTWCKAYDIEPLREWLFEQRFNGYANK